MPALWRLLLSWGQVSLAHAKARTRSTVEHTCMKGRCPSCARKTNSLAHDSLVHAATHCSHRHVAALEWHLPPLTCLTKGMRSSSTKFCHRVAHQRYAPLHWHLPPPNLLSDAHESKPLEWHLPSLNFTLGWLRKGMHRWNGTSSKVCPRVAHKRYAHPLKVTLEVLGHLSGDCPLLKRKAHSIRNKLV